MTELDIDAEDMRDTARLIWGSLDRVARDQSEDTATACAVKNIHGNTAYLCESIGDANVIEMLGELRESILARVLHPRGQGET